MFVDVKRFLQGVRTLSSFTVHSNKHFSVLAAETFVLEDVPEAGMERGRKTPTDQPRFFSNL